MAALRVALHGDGLTDGPPIAKDDAELLRFAERLKERAPMRPLRQAKHPNR